MALFFESLPAFSLRLLSTRGYTGIPVVAPERTDD